MDERSRKKWAYPHVYLPASLILVGIAAYFFTLSPHTFNFPHFFGKRIIPASGTGSIYLPVNKTQHVDGLNITYKGMESGDLLIDVILPDLDKEQAYHRRIPHQAGRKGFKLGKTRFQIISAQEKVLRLRLDE